ncbi:MAG: 3-dehydroquinate synthase [Gammaproteobacteria bacterium]|nr:3-dehydroquinate synthase [Gammaproteobacteria bacterium]
MSSDTGPLLETITVDLDDRSYPIHIGADFLSDGALIQPHIRGTQACIISNETVAPLYLKQVTEGLSGFGLDLISLVLPNGEEFKTQDTISTIYDHLLEANFSRSSTLIALGGGVVGDMVGFAAATYQRGIDFIQIPTTLLSQVDSSVGGKTGVNHPLGKNMIGAFYQPRCVLADSLTLNTLPDRELKAGLAEVVKYGLINNKEFLEWLDGNIEKILARDADALAYVIKTSCVEKATIVAQDEKEAGIRAILNFGHTFGHAIETAMGYGKWLHGEAVAVGMVMAAELSCLEGLLSSDDAGYVKKLIARCGLPVEPPQELDSDTFLALMGKDKKAEAGTIRFILLEQLGKAFVSDEVDLERLKSGLISRN